MSDEKLVMGYWDCATCSTKHINGTIRDCPSCGQPRGDDVNFYMDTDHKEYVTDESIIDRFDDGPDWLCPACGALNNYNDTSCKGCGTTKNESSKDYFSAKLVEDDRIQEEPIRNKDKDRFIKIGSIVSIVLLFMMGLWLLLSPSTVTLNVTSIHWTHTTNIEKYKEVYENDWMLPSDARLDHTSKEIKKYESVLDNYKTETYTEKVQTGTKSVVKYKDNGNGTFTEYTVQEPVYENVTKTREVPVYKDVPIYSTKYYYYVYKWVPDHNAVTQGYDKNTYWSELNLDDNEREGKKTTKYEITGLIDSKDTKTYELDYSLWKQFEQGKDYRVKTSFGRILSIEEEL